MKLYKKRSVLMINSPKLVNFMQMVRGVKLERGCRSFPTEDWITLVRDMNLTLRKWNSSLGPKSVFEYDNGQVICNSRNIMELYRPPLPVPEEVKLAATVAPPVATVAPKVPEAIVSASPEAKPASLFVNDPLVPVAQQSKPIGLFTLAERIGELTSDDFAVNYPVLFRYYKDLDAMSFQDIFDRDELYDFWTDPVWKDGQIAKEHRVLWYKQPVCAETATLAIQMCTRTRMDVAGARWLCMYFNNTGCSNDAWCCDFHHICLYCGSKEHGLTNCWMARKLYGEAHKFRGSFALDPLNPSSKWGGKSLEKTLLKLVKEQEDLHHNIDETSPADHETSTDALLSWYLSETESTTEDASKSSGRADVTDLSQEEGEPAEAPRTSFELRKDAEAFPTPRSQSDFDPRPQELAQNGMPEMSITTLMISQIPEQTDAESFRRQLDSRGFIGTYNFFYMPPDVSEGWGGRCVFINFVDQAMANMCMSAFQQCPSEGVAAPYNVQGLENNIAHFSQFVGAGDVVNGPLIVPTPAPLAWALNGAQAMMNSAQGKFSPQIRGQFLKTKMCAFHQKKKCTMGVACPFAHCTEELNAPPDLSKTKLCVNFFRRKCNDMNCKFAHGHRELRATGNVYKTELCRAWASGSCKVGDTCRYAHGVKELRSGMGAEYLGSMDDHYMSDGQMGCDVMGGLQGIWEDEAAQHYNGNGSMSSAAQGEPTYGRSDPTSGFSYGQPQDGAAEGYDDAMSDMGLSGVSTLCPGVRTFPLPREAGGSDPDEWTADDVAQWLWNLEGDKHRRYVPKFKEELIDGKSLRLLSLTDLKDLEVKELRNRKVIFEEIQKLFRP